MNDALTQRIEQLITKYEALQDNHQALQAECANLQHRLQLASQRIDAVIARLPAATPSELDL